MDSRILYKSALRTLIGAVGISAALGIFALLRQDLDEWSGKILGTTLFVSAAAFLIMPNAIGLRHRYKGYYLLSMVGLATTLVALPVFLYALWVDAEIWKQEDLWKLGASLEIFSIFTAHSALLSQRRLPDNYRWLMPFATLLGAALTSLVVWMIWGDVDSGEGPRAAGILSILLVSTTIIISILPRLISLDGTAKAGGNVQGTRAGDVGYCPNCGQPVSVLVGKGSCKKCGASFAVKFGGEN